MDIRELYNDANIYNNYFYLMTQKNMSKKSEELEFLFHTMGLSIAVTVIQNYMVILGVRNKYFFPDENQKEFNTTTAISLAKAFGCHVIVGNGTSNPDIYDKKGEENNLQSKDFEHLIYILTGIELNKGLTTVSYHDAPSNPNANMLREVFYYRTKDFGTDIIATELVADNKSMGHSSKWLSNLKKNIKNPNALKYIDEVEENSLNYTFDD